MTSRNKGGLLMREILAIPLNECVEPEDYSDEHLHIGEEMNDFEKQIFTLMMRYGSRISRIDTALNTRTLNERNRSSLVVSKEHLIRMCDGLNNRLIFEISDRLNLWAMCPWVTKGYKVILIKELEVSSELLLDKVFGEANKLIEDVSQKLKAVDDLASLKILQSFDTSNLMKN